MLCALCVSAFGGAAAIHYHRLGLTLSHYDARAHLVVSRRIFDSLFPGWQQVGGVWLPLPHLLDALPIQIDWLYRTGYSAVAISIASMALASWAITSLIARATGSIVGGIVAAGLLMLNPNVLYLQSTPMTEPLLFATTFLAVALVAKWSGTTAPRGSSGAGWALVAAALTRFEAWPIIAALIGLAFVVLVCGGVRPVDALRRARGLALWPMWAVLAFVVNSKVTVGSWFVSSGFFVPDNPTRGHPWLAWRQVWEGNARLSGRIVPWLACVSALGIVAFAFTRKAASEGASAGDPAHHSAAGSRVILLVLSLAACAVLPWAAYYQGHPVRIRYDVPLVAACAALIGAGVAMLPRVIGAAAGVVVIVIAASQTHPFDRNAPVVVEAQRAAAEDFGRLTVTTYLASHWDGQPIMMSMGSLAPYMHDLSSAGFNVRDFLHEGNGELWKYAMRSPRPYVAWIAIQERADRDDIYRQTQVDPRFLEGYARVVSGGGVVLYRRCTGDCRFTESPIVTRQSRIESRR